MFGTIIGDIIGSRFEFMPNESRVFDLFHAGCNFTDDTICQTALVSAMGRISTDMDDEDIKRIFIDELDSTCNSFPDAGYGKGFKQWLSNERKAPYGSYGNGCIMRSAPCSWKAGTDEEAIRLADLSCVITHDHPDAVEATRRHAILLRLAIAGGTRDDFRKEAGKLGIELLPTEHFVGKKLKFWDAKRTLSLAASLISNNDNPEDIVRDIVLIGSDTDTTAAIALQFEEAFGNIPSDWYVSALRYFGHATWDSIPIPTAAFLKSSATFQTWATDKHFKTSFLDDIIGTKKKNMADEDDIFHAHERLVAEQDKLYSSFVTRFFARILYKDKR